MICHRKKKYLFYLLIWYNTAIFKEFTYMSSSTYFSGAYNLHTKIATIGENIYDMVNIREKDL